jgi:hypothetical protein
MNVKIVVFINIELFSSTVNFHGNDVFSFCWVLRVPSLYETTTDMVYKQQTLLKMERNVNSWQHFQSSTMFRLGNMSRRVKG